MNGGEGVKVKWKSRRQLEVYIEQLTLTTSARDSTYVTSQEMRKRIGQNYGKLMFEHSICKVKKPLWTYEVEMAADLN